jgi:NAD(P)-dependent dehydrogenase (short-subunit alcohol dehydrogenase family)
MTEDGRWTVDSMPEVSGKVAIVTGANSGIGFEAARALTEKGGRVVMACRSLERGQAALREIMVDHPHGDVELMELDLADLASLRRFAERYLNGHDDLHLLINNAGVMFIPQLERTADGFEMQFGTNHLGHFALTGLLLEALARTPGARVVTVTSFGYILGRIDFDNLNAEKSYSSIGAYTSSKLANLLFTYELQRRFESAGVAAISTASHPGWTATNLQRHVTLFQVLNNIVAMRPAKGALSTLYAATAPDVEGGSYFGPRGLMQVWGYPKQLKSSRRSHDRALAEGLWAVSEELTGVRYDWSVTGQ